MFLIHTICVFLMMVTFTVPILKVNNKGGWSYIVINKKYAQQLKPGTKKSFRVKGMVDKHPIQKTSILPIGDGNYMLPINSGIRKATGKKAGDKLVVSIQLDERKPTLSPDLITCLKDDPDAMRFFKSLSAAQQQFFSKWIADAKTDHTKTKRLTTCLIAFDRMMNFQETIELYKTTNVS